MEWRKKQTNISVRARIAYGTDLHTHTHIHFSVRYRIVCDDHDDDICGYDGGSGGRRQKSKLKNPLALRRTTIFDDDSRRQCRLPLVSLKFKLYLFLMRCKMHRQHERQRSRCKLVQCVTLWLDEQRARALGRVQRAQNRQLAHIVVELVIAFDDVNARQQ